MRKSSVMELTQGEYISKISEASKTRKPLVVVRCITYNQEKYITETLEGFLKQKTNFPFMVIVHDDASTDKTRDILQSYVNKYPDIIFPIYEEKNLYSSDPRAVATIMDKAIEASGAEYVAMCEGDDYWITDSKLQKQVDFLEKNPEYGMCYTGFDIKNEIRGTYEHDLFNKKPYIFQPTYTSPEEFILKKGYVCPPSWLIRKKFWNTDLPSSLDGTFVRFTDLLAKTKVKLLPEVTCVYREISESASHSADYEKTYKRNKNLLATQLLLIDKFNLSQDLKKECQEAYYRQNLRSFVMYGKRQDVAKAKKELKKKTYLEKALFLIDSLRLNKMLKLARTIKKGN